MSEATVVGKNLAVRAWNTASLLTRRQVARRRQWTEPRRLQRLQDRRVRRIVAFAYDTVPFYRTAMDDLGLVPENFATAADLTRLPTITGDDLAAHPDRFRSTALFGGANLEISTTGTSGRYKVIAHDDTGLLAAFATGVRSRDVVRAIAGSGHLRGLTVAPPQGTGLVLEAWWLSRILRPRRHSGRPTFVSVSTPVEQAVATVNRIRPHVIRGFGSAVGYLYRWADRHDREIWLPRVIVFGGDHLPEPDRELIEDRLGVPVVSEYQACEALMIAHQCELRRGLHVSSDLVHLRVVDDDGDDVAPGTPGGIVISNLVNRATVLLNYRLGDRGVLSGEPCACGRTLPVLAHLEGRADDLLVRSDGERVHEGVVLKELHSIPGVLEVQVTQHELTRVEVQLVTMTGHEPGGVARTVERALHDLLGGSPEVDVRAILTATIPPSAGGKRRMVVSACSNDLLPQRGLK